MSAVQTPPAASGDPLHEGVRVQEPDFWGLICDLTLALGDTPLEDIVWRYDLGRFAFILNSTGEMVHTGEAIPIGILECLVLYYPPKAGNIGQTVMRVSPWECKFCESGYDYSVLAKVIEEETERLLELDKAEL
jgi:hypothetical protein